MQHGKGALAVCFAVEWLAASASAGCAPPTAPMRELGALPKSSLDDPTTVVSIANVASAPNVFHLTYDIYRGSGDAACPGVRAEADGSVTYFGGCTDASNFTWFGTASVRESGDGNGEYAYAGFGWSMPWACGGEALAMTVVFDGTVSVHPDGDRRRAFSVELLADRVEVDWVTCAQDSLIYVVSYEGAFEDGTVDSDWDGQPDVRTWNGNGLVGTTEHGVVSARTTDLVIDDLRCGEEALEGRLKLWSGLDCATVEYDGGHDCDVESTVTWRYNGSDRGEVDGVPAVNACAVRAPGRATGRSGSALALAAVVLLLLVGARLLGASRNG